MKKAGRLPRPERWPFLGWMSIREMQEHIKELRNQVEQLEARLTHKKGIKACATREPNQ